MSSILVIEDNQDIRQATLEFLELESFEGVGFQNGLEALDYLSDERNPLPQLIVADLSMPIMNGMEFRQRQMANDRIRHIPMVIMSADSKILEKCKALGIEDILRKPMDLDELLAVVAKFVQK